MKYKIALCDDSDADRQSVLNMVERWAAGVGHAVHTDAFTSAESFLFHYAEESDYDIFLLDVEMQNMTGIELAKRIRTDNNRAEIIFITSHFEFAGEGYEVDALHYLVKPISESKLAEVLSKAAAKLSIEPPYVVISCEGETLKLYEADVVYIEAFLHYLEIHTRDRTYRIKESMAALESKLSHDFFRVHRSYMVSLKAITRISRSAVTVDGKIDVPLARGRYDDINRAFIERN